MMYSNRFVCAVKVNGKILREDTSGVVHLPFGAEYELLLKNLNSVRSVAKVTVDGKEASGQGLIIPANGSVDLERFIRDGNLDKGNKFKFIERTAGIEAHKGIGSDDGLIRVEFRAEKVVQKQTIVTEHVHHHRYNQYDYWPYHYSYGYPYGGILGGQITYTTTSGGQQGAQGINVNGAQGASNAQSNMVGAINMAQTDFISSSQSSEPIKMGFGGSSPKSSAPSRSPSASLGTRRKIEAKAMRKLSSPTRSRILRSFGEQERSAPANDFGITVAGSESNQRFTIGEYFPLEETSHVIVLQLRGEVGGKKVIQAVTVKTKVKCETCGTPSKAGKKFCEECGTALFFI